jgi:hypothetical protein
MEALFGQSFREQGGEGTGNTVPPVAKMKNFQLTGYYGGIGDSEKKCCPEFVSKFHFRS